MKNNNSSASSPAIQEKQHTTPETPERNGYKQTALGWIPDEWEVNKIGELANKVGSGITPRGGEKVYKDKGRYFIRSQNIGWGQLLLDDVAFIDEEIHYSFPNTELKMDDVLLNITGASIGRSAIVDNNIIGGNVNQHVCIIRPNSKLQSKYLNLYLISTKGQNLINSFQAGGNRQGLNFEQIKSLPIPLPPLPEQLRIAALLSTWDEAIHKTQELIAQLQQRNKGLMQQLLTGKKRLKGFSGEWKRICLNKLCKISKGEQLNKLELEKTGQYPSISGGMEPSGYTKNWNTNENTIIISEGGNSCGFVNFIKTKFWCGGHCYALLNLSIGTNKTFLFQSLKYNELKIMNLRVGSGLPNVQKKDIEKFNLNIPPEAEQTAIAQILLTADNEVKLYEQKLTTLQQQKKGLMQVLLTGEKRLKTKQT